MTDPLSCDIEYVDREKVMLVSKQLANHTDLQQLTETFRLLADPTRLKIILALNISEMCVCDLASLLEVSRSAVSHQLRLLRNRKLVKYRRQGKSTYYSLIDEHISGLIDLAVVHSNE
jgi:DNA-binding transcriptional ArsR family regulator